MSLFEISLRQKIDWGFLKVLNGGKIMKQTDILAK